MMNIFIGIDPSINSTGLTIRTDDGYCQFFIIKENKLSKKEMKAATEYSGIFHYCQYLKENVHDTKNAYERELAKAHNLSNIADTIYNVISEAIRQLKLKGKVESITVCMEGISYGSIHSAAVMDLAGLNYLIRDRMHHHTVVGTLIVAPPAEIKKYATGQGNASKDLMVTTFKGSFPDFDLPKIDDISDSFFMSKYAQYMFENHNV